MQQKTLPTTGNKNLTNSFSFYFSHYFQYHVKFVARRDPPFCTSSIGNLPFFFSSLLSTSTFEERRMAKKDPKNVLRGTSCWKQELEIIHPADWCSWQTCSFYVFKVLLISDQLRLSSPFLETPKKSNCIFLIHRLKIQWAAIMSTPNSSDWRISIIRIIQLYWYLNSPMRKQAWSTF